MPGMPSDVSGAFEHNLHHSEWCSYPGLTLLNQGKLAECSSVAASLLRSAESPSCGHGQSEDFTAAAIELSTRSALQACDAAFHGDEQSQQRVLQDLYTFLEKPTALGTSLIQTFPSRASFHDEPPPSHHEVLNESFGCPAEPTFLQPTQYPGEHHNLPCLVAANWCSRVAPPCRRSSISTYAGPAFGSAMWSQVAASGIPHDGETTEFQDLPALLSAGALHHALLTLQSPASKVQDLGTQREQENLCKYAQLAEAVDASVLVAMVPALLRKLLQAQKCVLLSI